MTMEKLESAEIHLFQGLLGGDFGAGSIQVISRVPPFRCEIQTDWHFAHGFDTSCRPFRQP
jgi:hypothetical protein